MVLKNVHMSLMNSGRCRDIRVVLDVVTRSLALGVRSYIAKRGLHFHSDHTCSSEASRNNKKDGGTDRRGGGWSLSTQSAQIQCAVPKQGPGGLSVQFYRRK